MTALARVCINCKRQTPPLVREDAPHQQTLNYLTVIKFDFGSQMGALHQGRLTVDSNITVTFDF
jgi:hypothetical protein